MNINKTAQSLLNILSWLKLVPFNWKFTPDGTMYMELFDTRTLTNRIWYLLASMSIIQCVFLYFRLFQNWKSYVDNNLHSEMLLHNLYVSGYTMVAALYTHVVLYKDRIVLVANGLSRMNEQLQDRFKNTEQLKFITMLLNGFLIFLFMSGIGISISNGLLAYFSLHNKYYWFSIIPPTNNDIVYICCAVFEGLLFLTASGLFIVEIYLNLMYISTTAIFLNALRKLIDKDGRTFLNFYRIYKHLRLLNVYYNKSYGEFFFPALELLLGSLSVNLIYSAIKSLSIENYTLFTMTFIGGFGITICQGLLYPLAAKIYENSVKLVAKSNYISNSTGRADSREMQLFKKQQISMGYLKVQVGVFYEMQKHTPLTFFSVVINYSISLLMGLSLANHNHT